MFPLTKRSEAIADYLENDHWHNPLTNQQPDDSMIYHSVQNDESEFCLEELQWALKVSKLKNNQDLIT